MRGAYAPVALAFPQRGSSALCKGQTTAALIESDNQAEGVRARNVERKGGGRDCKCGELGQVTSLSSAE